MDRISELPQDIIHHIYSFLPTKDVVKTSLLSNLWHSIFVLYPCLDFDRGLFTFRFSRGSHRTNDLEFIKHVNESLLRLHKHNLDIKQFRLNMSCYTRDTLKLEQSVKEVLGFCRNIRVLELRNCVLKRWLSEECANLPCLNKLSLERVESDEFTLKKLLEGCPEVSDFTCYICCGLKSLSISGLEKLKILKLVRCRIDISVAIDAPVLESLHIDGHSRGDFKLVSGQYLKSVVLENGNKFNGELIEDLVSKSPVLESLTLYWLYNLNKLNMSSHHLKNLTIDSCPNLRDCNVNAPNLHSFRFKGTYITNSLRGISFASAVSCWWRIELDLHEVYQLSDLKKFLQGKKIKYLELSVSKGFVKDTEVAKFSRCCEVEHLSLRVSNSKCGSFEKIVHQLVSVCQPKELNVFKLF